MNDGHILYSDSVIKKQKYVFTLWNTWMDAFPFCQVFSFLNIPFRAWRILEWRKLPYADMRLPYLNVISGESTSLWFFSNTCPICHECNTDFRRKTVDYTAASVLWKRGEAYVLWVKPRDWKTHYTFSKDVGISTAYRSL